MVPHVIDGEILILLTASALLVDDVVKEIDVRLQPCLMISWECSSSMVQEC